MYNRIYDFLEKYQLIYSLQFCFEQNYSTSYALLNLAESVMKPLDEGNFDCGIFGPVLCESLFSVACFSNILMRNVLLLFIIFETFRLCYGSH